MEYGELILISFKDKMEIGKFISERPNGNIIADKYSVECSFDRYSIKSEGVYEYNKNDFIRVEEADVENVEWFFDILINKLELHQEKVNEDLIIKLENKINLLNKEVENTINNNNKPYSFSDNRLKAIQQKNKCKNKLERKLYWERDWRKERNKSNKDYYNQLVEKYTTNKNIIIDFIDNYI